MKKLKVVAQIPKEESHGHPDREDQRLFYPITPVEAKEEPSEPATWISFAAAEAYDPGKQPVEEELPGLDPLYDLRDLHKDYTPPNSRRKARDGISKTRSRNDEARNRRTILMEKYLDTGEVKYLYRFLFSSYIIDMGSDCITMLVEEGTSRSVKATLQDMEMTLGDYSFDEATEEIMQISRDPIVTLLDNLYRTNPDDIVYYDINSKEIYIDVFKKFRKKGIDMDEAFIGLRTTDFSKLRSSGGSIRFVYARCLGELILINGHHNRSIEDPCTALYDQLDRMQVGDIVGCDMGDEKIAINGNNYSRKVFESMVESDIDGFLTNLELESYMYERETAEGTPGDGHNDGGENTELL
uniref:Uncharacterized protein n=1 Tax=viral metagenome TaxID=1070528 RepID=A0A6M3JZG4_9ZZZZ